jgi:hypothetical protein
MTLHMNKQAGLHFAHVLLQVWGTQSVLHFFSSNEPWKTYTHNGNFVFRQLQPGLELRLSEAVSVTPAAVPHRAEFSDAVSYYIKVPCSPAAVHVRRVSVLEGACKQVSS